MRLRRYRWRVGLGALVMVAAAGGTVTAWAADADAFVFTAGYGIGPASGTPVPAVSYTLGSGACQPLTLPAPASTSVPGYFDAAGASGECSPVSGGGTILLGGATCDSGVIIANTWTLGEPGGDTAEFDGDGVMIGGVAVLAGPEGYKDDGGPVGNAVSVALFLPSPTDSPTCLAPGSVIASLAAAY